MAAKAHSNNDDVVEEELTKTPAVECGKAPIDESTDTWAIKRVSSDDTECKVVAGIATPLVGKRYSIKEAWPLFSKERTIKDEGTFKFLFPNLECGNCCFHKNGVTVLVGCPEYYKYCIESERWFDQDLIRSHAVLASHQSHNPKLQVINIATPMQELLPTQ